MKKKKILVFTLILLVLGITKVQAVEMENEIKAEEEKIETLIEMKQEGEWRDLEIEKYNKYDILIYKVGTNKSSGEPITISNKYNNDSIFRIVENGYNKSLLNEMGVVNDDDAYTATKIAIDCVFNKVTEIDSVDNLYRAKEGLEQTQKERANKIIEAVKQLLNIGYDETIIYDKSKSIRAVGELELDLSKPDYVSQRYTISTTQAYYKGFKVKKKDQTKIPYYIANITTREEQEVFNRTENQFRIMIPKEYQEEPFELELEVETIYDEDTIFLGEDGNNEYIILANIEEKYVLETGLNNNKSSLTVNFVDKETRENVVGGSIKVGENLYNIDLYNKILLNSLPKQKLLIEVVTAPENYVIDNKQIIADIKYKENHIENIELSRKKGNLKIITLVGKSTYEIYEEDNKIKGVYTTDEDGNLFIEGISTGEYIIKQIEIKEGYKLVEKLEICVLHGQTVEVTIDNEKIDKEIEPIPPKEEEKEPIPPKNETVEVTPPKEEKEAPEVSEIPELTEPKTEKDISTTELTRTVLPRTGNDYFVIKIILIDIILFKFIMYLFKKIQSKKNTDCQI